MILSPWGLRPKAVSAPRTSHVGGTAPGLVLRPQECPEHIVGPKCPREGPRDRVYLGSSRKLVVKAQMKEWLGPNTHGGPL